MTTARKENESFEEYKVRQKAETKAVKALKHGIVFWDSGYAGTYINPVRQAKKELKKEGK